MYYEIFFLYLFLFINFYLLSICLDILFFPFLIFLTFTLLMTVFSGPDGGSQDEMVCSPPGVRRTSGARVSHGRCSCEPASGPGVSQSPWSQQAGSSSSKCFLTHCRGPMGSPLWAPPQREPVVPPPLLLEHWGRRRCPCRRCLFPKALLRPLQAPHEALSFHWSCRGVLLSPAASLSFTSCWIL